MEIVGSGFLGLSDDSEVRLQFMRLRFGNEVQPAEVLFHNDTVIQYTRSTIYP